MLNNDARPFSQLLGDAVSQLSHLLQSELRLAKAEVSEKVAQASIGAAFVAVAAVVMIPALVVFLIAVALFLQRLGLSSPVAHLAAAVMGMIISVILAIVGLNRLKPATLSPTVTLRQIERDVAAVKEMSK